MNVPSDLQSLDRWILWREEERNGQPTKIPYQTNGEKAKSNDQLTWTSYEDAATCPNLANFSGLGFVLTKRDRFVGVDLDGCRDPKTGLVDEWAKEIILQLNSYAEVSPSGTGVKVFTRGEWSADWNRQVIDGDGYGGKQPGIEVYTQGRYFAITGRKLQSMPSEARECQADINWLAGKFKKTRTFIATEPRPANSVSDRAALYLSKLPPAISGQRGHDRTFRAACVLVLGFGLSQAESFEVLSEWNRRCEPPWSDGELRHKIEDADKQSGERNYLRDARPDQWENIRVPDYQPTPKPETTVPIKVETLEQAVRRYISECKAGKKRLFETGIPDLDAAIGGGYDRGELIVIGARPSHGKSMVAMQMIHTANANNIPVALVSQEMSALALGERAMLFASEHPAETHWQAIDELERDAEAHFEKRADTFIIESCASVNQAVDEIERHIEDHGVKLAVLDYAQILRAEGKTQYERVTNTSIALKSLAHRTGIPVILLAQLSREIEKRGSFLPQMSDLKESGQLEQDADVVLFLVWPHRIDQDQPANEYQVFIAKNRNRKTTQHALTMKFEPSRQRLVRMQPVAMDGWIPDGQGGF